MAGFGAALVFTPSYIMVGQYFDKRKGVAMSLGTIGAGAGAVVFGPSIAYMMHNLGYTGCMLTLAAIEFHCCVAGALMRPFVEKPQPAVELEIAAIELNDAEKQTQVEDSQEKKNACASALLSFAQLFSDVTRVLYYACIAALPMSFGVVIYFLPDAAMLEGFTDTEGAWLLSVFGTCDVIGRLFWGFIFDFKPIRQRRSVLWAILGELPS